MTRDSYEMVPIDSLAPSGYNPNVLSAEDFAALINELRGRGRLQKPIVARNGPAIPHEIIEGEHNWRAAKEVGFTEVPVQREDADDFEARRQTLIRNRTGKKDNLKLGCCLPRTCSPASKHASVDVMSKGPAGPLSFGSQPACGWLASDRGQRRRCLLCRSR